MIRRHEEHHPHRAAQNEQHNGNDGIPNSGHSRRKISQRIQLPHSRVFAVVLPNVRERLGIHLRTGKEPHRLFAISRIDSDAVKQDGAAKIYDASDDFPCHTMSSYVGFQSIDLFYHTIIHIKCQCLPFAHHTIRDNLNNRCHIVRAVLIKPFHNNRKYAG